MKERYYQKEADDAIFQFFREHKNPDENPVIAMPTGTGKSHVIGNFCKRVLQTWPGQRILNLVHVKELVEQNALKMKMIWLQAPVGIYSAGLGSKEAHMPITFAGVQSVYNNLTAFGPQDIVIIDECHLVPPEEETMYRKVIAYFKARNPYVRFIGLSATIYRLGLGMITDGGVFTHVAYDCTSLSAFNRLINEGFLCPLIPMKTDLTIDVKGIKKIAGEFSSGDLERHVNREEITVAAINETIEQASDRNHWLIFATGIDHAKNIMAELNARNISCTGVWSKGMSNGERDENIRKFKAGEVRAMVNVGILLVGFDFPELDCIVGLRPTNSIVLHIQMLGRGTRPVYASGFDLDVPEGRLAAIASGPKQNTLVLDFAGNVLRLGPINDPRIPKKKGAGTGDIPIKVCGFCGCLCHISARVCDNCGAAFPIHEKLTEKASTAALIVRDEPEVHIFNVERITYETHRKLGSPDSLKVNYYCGLQRFTEWVCLEHYGSKILHKAHHWWSERSSLPPPTTIAQAHNQIHSVRQPRQIRVWINCAHPTVLSPIF